MFDWIEMVIYFLTSFNFIKMISVANAFKGTVSENSSFKCYTKVSCAFLLQENNQNKTLLNRDKR